MFGLVDHTLIDTSPGIDSAFSPPAGWQGDEEAFLQLMRDRYRTDQGMYQQIELSVWFDLRYQGTITYVGPHAQAAKMIVSNLKNRRASA